MILERENQDSLQMETGTKLCRKVPVQLIVGSRLTNYQPASLIGVRWKTSGFNLSTVA